MKNRLVFLVYWLAVSSCCPILAQSQRQSYHDKENTTGMHDAGLFAFNYGPAILTSWKSAIYLELSNPNAGVIEPIVFPKERADHVEPSTFDRYQILEKDEGIDSVKSWLQEHLQGRINLSPNTPATGALAVRFNYILLFSSAVPSNCDWDDDGEPILFRRTEPFKNEILNKTLLLAIPCTEEIFGWPKDKARQDIDLLKSLMHYTGKIPSIRSSKQTHL